MSMYFYAGDAARVFFDFKVDGDFVVPDLASVVYTVRANDGTPIGALTDVAVTTAADTTRVSVEVPSIHNAKTSTVEKRTISLTYVHQGEFQRIEKSYFLMDWLDIAATPDQVRRHLGLNENELRDHEVDLIQAYYDVSEDLDVATLGPLLIGGDRLMLIANKAIIYKAALTIMVSVPVRASQSEAGDTYKFSRFSDIDWERLKRDTSAFYGTAIREMDGLIADVTPTLIVVDLPTDPVTNT